MRLRARIDELYSELQVNSPDSFAELLKDEKESSKMFWTCVQSSPGSSQTVHFEPYPKRGL
jgi:hypothetical protein